MLSKISLAFLCFAGATAHAQTAGCTRLLEFDNDLWLAQPDRLPLRISNDGGLKPAAALHPNAALVAYSTLDATIDLLLADASGRVLTRLALGLSDPIVALSWVSPSVLRASEHRGPNYSQYHFFTLDAGNRLSRATSGEAVCSSADSIALSGQDGDQASAAQETATPIQTLNLAQGTSLLVKTVPPMRVEFKTQSAGTVTLRIVDANGLWREQRVPTGHSMVLPGSDDESAFEFEPVRTADPLKIKLMVRQRAVKTSGFEGKIVRDPSQRPHSIKPAASAPATIEAVFPNGVARADVRDWVCK